MHTTTINHKRIFILSFSSLYRCFLTFIVFISSFLFSHLLTHALTHSLSRSLVSRCDPFSETICNRNLFATNNNIIDRRTTYNVHILRILHSQRRSFKSKITWSNHAQHKHMKYVLSSIHTQTHILHAHAWTWVSNNYTSA